MRFFPFGCANHQGLKIRCSRRICTMPRSGRMIREIRTSGPNDAAAMLLICVLAALANNATAPNARELANAVVRPANYFGSAENNFDTSMSAASLPLSECKMPRKMIPVSRVFRVLLIRDPM